MDESTDLTSTSQLLIFIRGVNFNFEITEQLASVCSMHGTTTGEDLFLKVEKTLQCYSLHWNKLQCITVVGEKKMAGLKKGLVGRIMSKLKTFISEKLFFAVHYTSASTLFETFGYFLRNETSRLGGELHSESRINSPPITEFSSRNRC